MDADRFDSLARSVTSAPSRRGVARALAGLTLSGMLALRLGLADTEARKRRKKRKKKKNGNPSPTCVDGIRNGSEADVDCGGPDCPRCGNGQTCGSRNDCASALCSAGTCAACGYHPDCGNDAKGPCYCSLPVAGGSPLCISSDGVTGPFPSCAATNCPAGTVCGYVAGLGNFCAKPCDAP